MYQTPNLLHQRFFMSIAFPSFSGESDDAEINIVERYLKSAWSRAIFPDGIYLANVLFAIEFKWY